MQKFFAVLTWMLMAGSGIKGVTYLLTKSAGKLPANNTAA